MTESKNGSAPESAVQRAEALLDRFGKRVREARAEAVKKEETVKAAVTEASAQQPARPATERADEILDRTGEQMGRLGSAVSLRVRKFTALAREEAEDILAEAQTLRQGNHS